MAKYDWDFIKPIDNTASINALATGNNQINTGLAGIAGSVTGLADAFKQRNTDEILNTLMQAQTSAELPNALNAVAALQQQYGRGYDQSAVRTAMDTHGSTLGQRDLQNINLQQAQAAQAAIPQMQQVQIERMRAMGVSEDQISAYAGINGIDTSSLANTLMNDFTGERTYNTGRTDRAEDVAYRNLQADRSQSNWEEGNELDKIKTAASISPLFAQDPQQGWTTDEAGNPVPFSSSGVSKGAAFGAIMDGIFQTESNKTHRKADGSLVRSPKGALGIAQIMPATAAKPGYGMKPINLQNTSPQEQQAWAQQYITKIAGAHNFTTEQAVAAYNAGPGAVQKAIKSGGSSWLSKLPKETQNYVPKVLGGANRSNASGAMNAVGAGVSNADIVKATSGYQDTIAKITSDYESQNIKDQTKGSVATTGKNIDTWVANKKDSGLIFSNNNSFFTKADDLASMAKKDPTFNKLPESAQMNILEGTYAKLNNVNALQYVPDADLAKFISSESKRYPQERQSQFAQQKKAAMESAYQNVVQAYQKAGAKPPSREGVARMLDPQADPKQQQQQRAKAPVNNAKAAVAAVRPQPVPSKPAVATTIKSTTSAVTAPTPREIRKAAELESTNKRAAARKTAELREAELAKQRAREKAIASQAALTSNATAAKNLNRLFNKPNGKPLTQKEMDALLKKYKVS